MVNQRSQKPERRKIVYGYVISSFCVIEPQSVSFQTCSITFRQDLWYKKKDCKIIKLAHIIWLIFYERRGIFNSNRWKILCCGWFYQTQIFDRKLIIPLKFSDYVQRRTICRNTHFQTVVLNMFQDLIYIRERSHKWTNKLLVLKSYIISTPLSLWAVEKKLRACIEFESNINLALCDHLKC